MEKWDELLEYVEICEYLLDKATTLDEVWNIHGVFQKHVFNKIFKSLFLGRPDIGAKASKLNIKIAEKWSSLNTSKYSGIISDYRNDYDFLDPWFKIQKRNCHLLRLKSCQHYLSLNKHKGRVLTLAFSPDGRYLASGGADGQVVLYDTRKKYHGQILNGHNGRIDTLSFCPKDGRYLAGGVDNKLIIWNIKKRKIIRLSKFKSSLSFVDFTSNGNFICVGSDDYYYFIEMKKILKNKDYSESDAVKKGVSGSGIFMCYSNVDFTDSVIGDTEGNII